MAYADSEAERKDLLALITRCTVLLPVLSALMSEQPGLGPSTGTIGRHAPESKEPWAGEAANAYWGLYFGSRHIADMMRAHLGMPDRVWATGEDGLKLIAALASSVTAPVLRSARVGIERALASAQRIRDLDEADAWTPVPRAPGQAPPVCPYCSTLSLRVNRQLGEVRCFFPGCVDANRKPTMAQMEYDALTGAGVLVFGDGYVVAYRENVSP